MLELAILGLLKEGSMHGYQLSKRLTEALGGFWRVSYGSLYPTLRRLEVAGAVEQVSSDPLIARRKTVYRITEKGEKLFIQLLEEVGTDSATEDTRFRIRLAFFRYLAPATRIRVLERRRASLEERLSSISRSLTGAAAADDPYTRSLMQHGRDALEQDIEWLDGLIAAERRLMTTTGGTRPRSLRRKERLT
ncbi:MAG: PadR family transcriptional regulator [Actinomycetota bacterium]